MSKSINKPRAYLVTQNGEIAERSRNTEKAKPNLGSQAPLNNRRGSIEDAAQTLSPLNQTTIEPLKDIRILRLEVNPNKRRKSNNPNSKYLQKMRARMENEERIFELYKHRKDKIKKRQDLEDAIKSDQPFRPKEDVVELDPYKKHEVDMKEIIRKALLMRLGKPQDQIFIQHLSPLRVNRHRRGKANN